MSDDILKRIEQAESVMYPIHARMDEDAQLAHQSEYKLRDKYGREIPDVISVTTNEAAVFLNAIVAMIQESTWQTRVEGRISDKQCTKVEEFIDHLLRRADDNLLAQGKPQMFPFFANHICARGWVGARVLTRKTDDGGLMPEILPVDVRYLLFERGGYGLRWAAIKTERTPEQIMAEYDIEVDSEKTVIDYWDSEQELVFIEKDVVKRNKNPYGFVPFVVQPSSAGFMLWDDTYASAEGESIFALNRNLYEEFNRLVSIDQTLAMQAIMPSYEKQSKEFTNENTPYPNKIGAVFDVMEGENYRLIERPDLNQASQVAHQNIAGGLQRGGINNIDLGNITFPTSAVWISEQTEIRNKLVAPRISALGVFYERIADMLIREFYNAGAVDSFVVNPSPSVEFKASDIPDPNLFKITMRLMSNNKKQEIANVTVASQARGLVSRETLIREVLAVQDPEMELSRLEAEDAEQLEPALKLFRMACAKVDQADVEENSVKADQLRLESMMLTEKAVLIIKQERMEAQLAQQQAQNALGTPRQQSTGLRFGEAKNKPQKGPWNASNYGMDKGGRPPKMEGGGEL